MKELEILAQMCIEVNELLGQLYEKGSITRETYEEHTRLKLHFLQKFGQNSAMDDPSRGTNVF